jgi:hypothetical protein
MYTEPEMIDTVNRLIQIYLESYPDDRESLERFQQWMHAQYGYQHGNT